MLKRIASLSKKRTLIKDTRSGKDYEYFVIRLAFDDVPGEEDAAIDVWSDIEHGYMRVELAKRPNGKVGD